MLSQDVDQSLDDLVKYLPPEKKEAKEALNIKLFTEPEPTVINKQKDIHDFDDTSNDSLLDLLDEKFQNQIYTKKQNTRR